MAAQPGGDMPVQQQTDTAYLRRRNTYAASLPQRAARCQGYYIGTKHKRCEQTCADRRGIEYGSKTYHLLQGYSDEDLQKIYERYGFTICEQNKSYMEITLKEK